MAAFLHSLQEVVNSHRADQRVIVLSFGWDGTAATVFSGLRPAQTPFWSAYLSARTVGFIFQDQPDVWIEVWNEPYRFDLQMDTPMIPGYRI